MVKERDSVFLAIDRPNLHFLMRVPAVGQRQRIAIKPDFLDEWVGFQKASLGWRICRSRRMKKMNMISILVCCLALVTELTAQVAAAPLPQSLTHKSRPNLRQIGLNGPLVRNVAHLTASPPESRVFGIAANGQDPNRHETALAIRHVLVISVDGA